YQNEKYTSTQNAQCRNLAKSIENSVNQSVNPCDNFYRFACDKWRAEHSIADDRSSVSIFSIVQDSMKRQIIKILNATFGKGKAIEKLRSVYDECMNTERIMERNSQPLTNVINELNGWPVLMNDSWKEENFEWFKMLASVRTNGFSYDVLLSISVSPDIKQNTINRVK
ncbi:neprilysin-like protein, partial [Leptotrombidium deliense]